MLPLNTKDENDPNRPVKIKFVRNTAEGGENYGPDYPKKVAEVPFRRAATYVAQGRAVPADGDEALREVEESARAGGQLPQDEKKSGSKK